jgi:hypothetical protein
MCQRQEVKRKITLPLKREKRKKRKSKLFKNLENSSSSSNSENNKEKHNNRKENSQLNYLTEDNSQEIFVDISPPIFENFQNEIYEENEDNKILNDIWNSIESNNDYSIKSQPLGKMNMLRTKAKKLNFNEKFGNEENENLFLSKFQSKRTLNE